MRWVGMQRVIGTVLFYVLSLEFSGCFSEIEAPGCRTLADCPAGIGYASCESGRCFVTGRCDGAIAVPGDNCCPRVEGDRSDDLDCLLDDSPAGLTGLATPTLAAGTVFLAGLALDPGGTSQVGLLRRDADGRISTPRMVGPGKIALPPVSVGGSVFVAHRNGVAQVDAATWNIVRHVPSAAPTGGLAVAAGAVHPIVAWPTVEGDVVLLDTTSASDTVLAAVAGPLGDATAFPPATASHPHRVAFAWSGGALVLVDPEAARVTAAWNPPSPPEIAPTIVGETTVFAGEDRRLRGLVENDGTLRESWANDLEARPVGGLLADPAGRVVVLLEDGRVRGFDAATGALAGQGDFGTAMADLPPVLCPSRRLVAVTDDRAAIRTLLPAGTDGTGFTSGLRFDTRSVVTTGPGIAGDRLVLGTEAGRVAVWWFPPGPEQGTATRTPKEARDAAADATTGG